MSHSQIVYHLNIRHYLIHLFLLLMIWIEQFRLLDEHEPRQKQ